MAGPKTALLLETFARVGREGTLAYGSQLAASSAPKKRSKTGGCSPCEAMAKVQAAKDRAGVGGRRGPAPQRRR